MGQTYNLVWLLSITTHLGQEFSFCVGEDHRIGLKTAGIVEEKSGLFSSFSSFSGSSKTHPVKINQPCFNIHKLTIECDIRVRVHWRRVELAQFHSSKKESLRWLAQGFLRHSTSFYRFHQQRESIIRSKIRQVQVNSSVFSCYQDRTGLSEWNFELL